MPPRLLTIAGSDSGGGAGIQADLKTFLALGGYGMSVITAATAQNTMGVRAVHDLPPEFVAAQLDAVFEDIGVDAVKTGMLSNAVLITTIAERLTAHGIAPGGAAAVPIVVDPVMVATSGDPLLREDARQAVVEHMVPLACVLTPNLPEAEALSGVRIDSERSLRAAGKRLQGLGAAHVLIKGGHGSGPEAVDWLFDGVAWTAFAGPRIETSSTHGTGCTFAAALAAALGRGECVPDAIWTAKRYLTGAIRNAQPLGHGHGPVNHGWQIR